MDFKASDKYGSVKRAYERLKKVETDTGNSISNTDSRDTVEDFFNQCYHFKDWLINDSSLSLKKTMVEDYIRRSKGLSLAADYCNSFKHGLAINSRSGKKLEKINTHIKIDLVPDRSRFIASSRLELTIDGKSQDAFALATTCMQEWEEFLKQNAIVLPDP